MDPVTQGALGAAAAQLLLQKRLGRRAWLYGALGGMAADLDIIIRSGDDPLVAWTYHRHFTHSLAFVPVGGVLSGLPFIVRKPKLKRALILAATTVGYATHALLDAFTSYGTQLWLPFSSARVAWNWIGIIDPFFTLPLCFGVAVAARKDRLRPLWIAVAWCALYMGWGGLQHGRAVAHAKSLAQQRGHDASRVEAFPGVVTNVVWRTLYLSDGRIYVDAVHVPWWGTVTSRPGGSAAAFERQHHDALAVGDERVLEGLATFDWFADGWVAESAPGSGKLGDVRYGRGLAIPDAMWGVHVRPNTEHPFEGFNDRPDRAGLADLVDVWFEGFPPAVAAESNDGTGP
ncbi:MAG: metal-dependent hydrolase [Nannocystales bacterium]